MTSPAWSWSDRGFWAILAVLGGSYVVLIVLLLVATFWSMDASAVWKALASSEIRYATILSLVSCTVSTLLSLWVALPLAYILSRRQFRGKAWIEGILDLPIVLPPLVVGISLLILFNFLPRSLAEAVVFEIPAVILAQFTVSCAFAVRTLRVALDQIPVRFEQVALTLGASQGQAFWTITMPQMRRGLVAAGTLAWARSLGEFGPILVFAGSTRLRTEVLPTSIFLEMQSGNLQGMLAVSLIMIVAAAAALLMARGFGLRGVYT